MTERERMDAGLVYDPLDAEIMAEQSSGLELLFEYNSTRPSEPEKRAELLRKMFAKVGADCYIEPPFHANWAGKHVFLGDQVYANFNLTLVDDGNIYIGDRVKFGPNVTIATAGHPVEPELRERGLQFNRDIRIGNNVWIGSGAILLPGVSIGDNTVIGAGSVVTKDIPANVVAVGNPCRILRKINECDVADAYTGFAEVYDTFMDNVPYGEWADFLQGILGEYGIFDGLVLDLGCGTGSMTEALAERGYDMIGVDCSEEMLEIAIGKKEKSGHDILYLLQDMQAFELYGTVRAVVSVCDSLNYVTEKDGLPEVFRLVNNYLDPGGIFVFDFNTEYKYRCELGNRTIAEDREDCSFIWDNYYYEDERINEYELTLYIREEGKEGLYRKYQETHYQRACTLEEIRDMLEDAGLLFLAAYDAYTKDAPRADSGRICVVAQEQMKGKKMH